MSDTQASDDEAECGNVQSAHPAFATNQYANGAVINSWHALSNGAHFNPYSLSDSEPDTAPSHHLGLDLNGGQIVINNVAGSRAPLPGFSSFV